MSHRWIVFVSYTTREPEVRVLKPLVYAYLDELRLSIPDLEVWSPIYYDALYLTGQLSEDQLREELNDGIEKSSFMAAFISPGYVGSRWCSFEWLRMAKRETPACHRILPMYWKRDIRRTLPEGSPGFHQHLLSRESVDLWQFGEPPAPGPDRKRAATHAATKTLAFVTTHGECW